MSIKVLIVEDEPAISDMVKFSLSKSGYECFVAEDADQARQCLYDVLPDIVLLDWMLPGMSGIEFARYLKRFEETRRVPIIMLTARGEEEDKVLGLSSGVDDYVTKPYSLRELMERIKAVLRRSHQHALEDVIAIGRLSMDTQSHRVTVDGEDLTLGPKEYQLLHFFMKHHEQVCSRTKLLDNVWGSNTYVEARTVDVHVLRLRKILSNFGYDKLIQTVRGYGYRFSEKGI